MSRPKPDEVDLSIVVLCYRAGERVYRFVRNARRVLENANFTWEMVLVGNYSGITEDDTPRVVRDIASQHENIRSVVLKKEGMMGWDARSGMREARGNYLCLIDGDEQMPPGDIVRVYEKLDQDDLHFAKTYRKSREDGILRRIVSISYNCIFKLFFPGIRVRDVNSKPKIISRDAYRKMNLESDDWFLDAEMVIKAKRLGLEIGEVPTGFYKCDYRRSFVRPSAIIEFARNLIRARMFHKKRAGYPQKINPSAP